MGRKYLDELGVDYEYLTRQEKSERGFRWENQKKEYGFDERETWGLDFTFYCWLYERLSKYLEVADPVVDLNYHKFTFKDKEYTQKQMIEMMLNRLVFYFQHDMDYDLKESDYDYVMEIPQIWAIVLPYMWWQKGF